MDFVKYRTYQFEVDSLHELSLTLVVLDLENFGTDVLTILAADQIANILEEIDEILGAIVGILSAEGKRVVGEGVIDGDAIMLVRALVPLATF